MNISNNTHPTSLTTLFIQTCISVGTIIIHTASSPYLDTNRGWSRNSLSSARIAWLSLSHHRCMASTSKLGVAHVCSRIALGCKRKARSSSPGPSTLEDEVGLAERWDDSLFTRWDMVVIFF